MLSKLIQKILCKLDLYHEFTDVCGLNYSYGDLELHLVDCKYCKRRKTQIILKDEKGNIDITYDKPIRFWLHKPFELVSNKNENKILR